jgi:hypothetical protein
VPRYFSARELDTLRVLREGFLLFEEGASAAGPYWASEEELALYDETFAQRIGWKWDAVLAELSARERLPRGAVIGDWGCGTGIAVRRTLRAVEGVTRVHLHDHSPAAVDFAAERVRAEFPAVEVVPALTNAPDLLLLSHVLDELDPFALESVLELARASRAVLWVEPGSRRTARALGEVRERLRESFDVLAPCTHQAACGALTADTWCHSFAAPSNEVFTEGKWAEFSRELGIDLRSLPYAFLALARPGAIDLAGEVAGPNSRILGRPRLTRGRAELELCRAEGVASVDFLQRTDRPWFKRLEHLEGAERLIETLVEDARITRLASPFSPP